MIQLHTNMGVNCISEKTSSEKKGVFKPENFWALSDQAVGIRASKHVHPQTI